MEDNLLRKRIIVSKTIKDKLDTMICAKHNLKVRLYAGNNLEIKFDTLINDEDTSPPMCCSEFENEIKKAISVIIENNRPLF